MQRDCIMLISNDLQSNKYTRISFLSNLFGRVANKKTGIDIQSFHMIIHFWKLNDVQAIPQFLQ